MPKSEHSRAGSFKKSMGARHRVGIGLSYRPARLHRLAELTPWNRFLGSIKVLKNELWVLSQHRPTQWNLRGGKWSKEKPPKNSPLRIFNKSSDWSTFVNVLVYCTWLITHYVFLLKFSFHDFRMVIHFTSWNQYLFKYMRGWYDPKKLIPKPLREFLRSKKFARKISP